MKSLNVRLTNIEYAMLMFLVDKSRKRSIDNYMKSKIEEEYSRIRSLKQ